MKNYQWGFVALGVLLAPIPLTYLGVFSNVATAPGRVANRALTTDNIVTSYEWFFDTSGAFDARLAQVNAHKALLSGETDADERRRLKIELSGMQQSCRELATGYNAQSAKVNHSIFKGGSAPISLNAASCE